MITTQAMTVLYVADQKASAAFYRAVLDADPVLDVPGMTEFALVDGASLGLMPVTGIKKLLGEALPDPAGADGVPRAELYLIVDDAAAAHERAQGAGARELSPLMDRDWGDRAAYALDPDGHVLAFAERSGER